MTFFDILLHTALIVWTLIGLGVIVSMMIVGPQLLRTMREVDDMADAMKTRVLPVMEESQQLVDQLTKITAVISDDIEVVDHTIIRAAESVERMVELTEDRVAEVNALLSVAIDEAEETFISTAGLVRAFLPGRRKKKRRRLPGTRRRYG